MIYWLFLQLLLAQSMQLFSTLPPNDGWQLIYGRHDGELKTPLYRAKTPKGWDRIEPSGSTRDTMTPLCEFIIATDTTPIGVSIYNFPFIDMGSRIPALAQVIRWQKQINQSSALDASLTSVSRGGFIGILLEAYKPPLGLLAWSMALADEHAKQLLSQNHTNLKQMAADYTIKALGPIDAILMHKDEILAFARSFELIEEIP